MNYDFASDNTAPADPSVLAAIGAVNTGTVLSYGEDPWTAELRGALTFAFERALHRGDGHGAVVDDQDLGHDVDPSCSKPVLTPRFNGRLGVAAASSCGSRGHSRGGAEVRGRARPAKRASTSFGDARATSDSLRRASRVPCCRPREGQPPPTPTPARGLGRRIGAAIGDL